MNITLAERVGRVVVGVAAMAGGAVLLAVSAGVVAIVLEVLLVLVGADLVVTGALGLCPLDRGLGYVPASLKGRGQRRELAAVAAAQGVGSAVMMVVGMRGQ